MEFKFGKYTVALKDMVKCVVLLVLYLAFLYWVGSWWGLLVVPFIIDLYITNSN